MTAPVTAGPGAPERVGPVRLRLSRAKGFDLQALSRATNGLPAVAVIRPSLFGNPFEHDDRAQAVEAFERHCRGGTQEFEMGPGKLRFARNAHPHTLHWAWSEWLRAEGLPKLRGRNLACWCPLPAEGEPDCCHAAVLLRLANATPAAADAGAAT